MPLEIDRNDFYAAELPEYPAQGDIFLSVPLFAFPEEDHLTVIRNGEGAPFEGPLGEEVRLISQRDAIDAFGTGIEYVVMEVVMGAVAVMTPTCDLGEELWQVAPVLEFENEDANKPLVFGGHLQDRFPLVAHPDGHYADAYIELSDLRTLPSNLVVSGKRVAALNSDYQRELAEFASKLFGRFWGMNPDQGDVAPVQGLYRCLRDCFHHTLKPGEVAPFELDARADFPRCPNCDRIKKGAQYIPLTRHRRY